MMSSETFYYCVFLLQNVSLSYMLIRCSVCILHPLSLCLLLLVPFLFSDYYSVSFRVGVHAHARTCVCVYVCACAHICLRVCVRVHAYGCTLSFV